MVMRYHWGFAVGHVYARRRHDGSGVDPPYMSNIEEAMNDDSVNDGVDQCQEDDMPTEERNVGSDDDSNIEFRSDCNSSDSEDIEESCDDVDSLAFDEMYGDLRNYEVYD
jgi:hypothetical protein